MMLRIRLAHAIADCIIAVALHIRSSAARVIQAALQRQDRRDIALALEPAPMSARDYVRSAPFRQHLRTGLLMTCLILAYGAVDRIEQETERTVMAQQLAEARKLAAADLVECMNGRARFISADGKTAVVCRPAEEFPL